MTAPQTKTTQTLADYTPPDFVRNRPDASQSRIDLTDNFFRKIRAQEEMYVNAGFPADGLTDFLSRWFEAWEIQSVVALRECMADTMVYADPTISSRDWTAGRIEYDLYHLAMKLMGTSVFCPQDDTPRALPYYDFLDGNVRITVPWRSVGRARFTLRDMDMVGVDRYNMVRDPDRGWLIARIDTDGDLLGAVGQMLPIPIRAPKQRTVRIMVGVAQKIFPGLRGPQVRPFPDEEN